MSSVQRAGDIAPGEHVRCDGVVSRVGGGLRCLCGRWRSPGFRDVWVIDPEGARCVITADRPRNGYVNVGYAGGRRSTWDRAKVRLAK